MLFLHSEKVIERQVEKQRNPQYFQMNAAEEGGDEEEEPIGEEGEEEEDMDMDMVEEEEEEDNKD